MILNVEHSLVDHYINKHLSPRMPELQMRQTNLLVASSLEKTIQSIT